jgi:adenylylsulfate kinase
MRVLIMGLPGSGKTTLAKALNECLQSSYRTVWLNADRVREEYDDWDFSPEGRIRQSKRMRTLADTLDSHFAIADFVCPLKEMRDNFDADFTIWMDTIDEGRFDDTNKLFEPPDKYDFRITEKDAEKWAEFIVPFLIENKRRPTFNWRNETVQMLGRWQPWHPGHRALFERAIAKTGQVVIQIRDCQGWNNSNPFAIEQVKHYINRDLEPLYQGQYEIQVVPNIVTITYGRDVGYKIEQEVFDDAIHNISATKIRKEMGFE